MAAANNKSGTQQLQHEAHDRVEDMPVGEMPDAIEISRPPSRITSFVLLQAPFLASPTTQCKASPNAVPKEQKDVHEPTRKMLSKFVPPATVAGVFSDIAGVVEPKGTSALSSKNEKKGDTASSLAVSSRKRLRPDETKTVDSTAKEIIDDQDWTCDVMLKERYASNSKESPSFQVSLANPASHHDSCISLERQKSLQHQRHHKVEESNGECVSTSFKHRDQLGFTSYPQLRYHTTVTNDLLVKVSSVHKHPASRPGKRTRCFVEKRRKGTGEIVSRDEVRVALHDHSGNAGDNAVQAIIDAHAHLRCEDRRCRPPSHDPENRSTECLGVISRELWRRDPGDFCYAFEKRFPDRETSSHLAEDRDERNRVLIHSKRYTEIFPPSYFVHPDVPATHDYGYRNTHQSGKTVRTAVGQRGTVQLQPRSVIITNVSPGSPIPDKPSKMNDRYIAEYPVEKKILSDLLDVLPLWPRERLEMAMEGSGRCPQRMVNVNMIWAMTYSVMKGPFQRLRIRIGYNPTEYPLTAYLQRISMRFDRTSLLGGYLRDCAAHPKIEKVLKQLSVDETKSSAVVEQLTDDDHLENSVHPYQVLNQLRPLGALLSPCELYRRLIRSGSLFCVVQVAELIELRHRHSGSAMSAIFCVESRADTRGKSKTASSSHASFFSPSKGCALNISAHSGWWPKSAYERAAATFEDDLLAYLKENVIPHLADAAFTSVKMSREAHNRVHDEHRNPMQQEKESNLLVKRLTKERSKSTQDSNMGVDELSSVSDSDRRNWSSEEEDSDFETGMCATYDENRNIVQGGGGVDVEELLRANGMFEDDEHNNEAEDGDKDLQYDDDDDDVLMSPGGHVHSSVEDVLASTGFDDFEMF